MNRELIISLLLFIAIVFGVIHGLVTGYWLVISSLAKFIGLLLIFSIIFGIIEDHLYSKKNMAVLIPSSGYSSKANSVSFMTFFFLILNARYFKTSFISSVERPSLTT